MVGHAKHGGVAQRSEHSVHTRGVIGSNPITATILGALEKWLNSPAFHAGIHGFESHTCHQHKPLLIAGAFLRKHSSPARLKNNKARMVFCLPDALFMFCRADFIDGNL